MGFSRWMTVRERFAFQTRFASPDECWEWQGTIRNGYGYIKIGGLERGAHRVAYELAHPDTTLTSDQIVTHQCDNKGCVNPAHLRIGTPKSNMDEFHERGDHAAWVEKRWRLSPKQREEIRREYALVERPLSWYAEWYGVSISSVHRAVHEVVA